MLEGPLAHGQWQQTVAGRRWAGGIGLAAAVGLAYFLAAFLSYGLALQSEGLAVFWPGGDDRGYYLVVTGALGDGGADRLVNAELSPVRGAATTLCKVE